MKTKLIIVAMAAAGMLGALPASAASTTHTITVSASVTGNCKFNTAGPTTLTIANSGAAIDPSITGTATGSANVTFRCTTGTTSTIVANDGQNSPSAGVRRVKLDATNLMTYSLSLVNAAQVGSGHGAAGDKTVQVNASIADTEYQNAMAGSYTDSVVLTISP